MFKKINMTTLHWNISQIIQNSSEFNSAAHKDQYSNNEPVQFNNCSNLQINNF